MSFLKFLGEKAAADALADKQAGLFDNVNPFRVTNPEKFNRSFGPKPPPMTPQTPPTPKPVGTPQRPVNQPFQAPPPSQLNQSFARELPGRMSELAWLTGLGDRPEHLGPPVSVPGASTGTVGPVTPAAQPPAAQPPATPPQQTPGSEPPLWQSAGSGLAGLGALAAPFTRYGRFAGPLGVAAQMIAPTPQQRWSPASWMDAAIGGLGWGSAMSTRPSPYSLALAIPDAKQWWSKGMPTEAEIGKSPEDAGTFRGNYSIYGNDFSEHPMESIKRIGSGLSHPLDAGKMVYHDFVNAMNKRKQLTGSAW